MKSRTILAIAGCAIFASLSVYMIYDASSVKEAPKSVVRLQLEKKQDSPVLRTKEPDRPVVSNPSGAQKVSSGNQNKTRDKEDKPVNFVIPQENLSLLYIVKCSACHGRDGNGPVGPSIAGKSFEYNLQKLEEYKQGKVENTMMADLLTRTPQSELETLARECASFKTRN